MLRIVTDALVHVVFIAALLFVVSYARSKFQREPWSRWLMADTVVLLLLSGLSVLTIHWGLSWAGRDIVRLLAWAAVAGVMVWRLNLRWSDVRASRRDNRSTTEDTSEHGT